MSFIDSHCHLADPRIFNQAAQIIADAQKNQIDFFLQAGVDPQDWLRQRQLQKQFSGVWPCFGLHPYFIADHTLEICEQAFAQLAGQISSAYALGETGLDFRPQIVKDSMDRQLDFFERQLELAQIAGKAVVLHIVRAFDEATKVLHLFGVPPSGGFVHAFNGSVKQAETYLNLGLYISVGSAVCRTDNQRLHQAVQALPLERLLLESDSPDQPLPGKDSSQPSQIWQVAESIGQIKGLPAREILDKSSQNLRKLLAYDSQ